MPLPIATLVDGKTSWGGGPEELEELPRGWIGKRWYRIEGLDQFAASRATGLPVMNQPWSDSFRGLKVVSRRIRRIGGVEEASPNYGGWTSAEISYATPDASGSTPIPELNRAYSQWQGAQEAITRNFDARVNPPAGFVALEPPGGPFPTPITAINNGKGVQVGVGTARLLVHKWVRGVDVPITRMMELHRVMALNSDAVQAPPMVNDTRTWNFAAGQLQYLEFDIQPDGELTKITHVLGAAPDFFYRWQPEDENGDAAGPIETNAVYVAAAFAGLW